jgi:hypothetical protein
MLGADGIKIDGVGSGTWPIMPAKYPDHASYLAAVDSFVRYVSHRVRSAGMLVIVNSTQETWTSGPWSQWVQLVDGVEYEPAISNPEYETASTWRGLWESYKAYPDKLYVQYVPNPVSHPAYFRFGLASYLLWSRPNSYLGLICINTGPPAEPLLDIDIGQPIAETEELVTNVYTRQYEQGRVYLNVNSATSAWVDVPPGLVVADTGEPATEGPRLLAPREPLILLRQA